MSERKEPVDPNEVVTVPTRFKCWRCGACCQSIGGIEGYETLDDGTGTCIHFDRKTRNCQIYENRPLLCNVWGLYHEVYEGELSEEDYSLLNIESCRNLRAELGLPEPEVLLARKKAREAGVVEKPEPKPRQRRRPLPQRQASQVPVPAPDTATRPPASQQVQGPQMTATAGDKAAAPKTKPDDNNPRRKNIPATAASESKTKPEFKVVKGQAGRGRMPKDALQAKTMEPETVSGTTATASAGGNKEKEHDAVKSDDTPKRRPHERKNWLGF